LKASLGNNKHSYEAGNLGDFVNQIILIIVPYEPLLATVRQWGSW